MRTWPPRPARRARKGRPRPFCPSRLRRRRRRRRVRRRPRPRPRTGAWPTRQWGFFPWPRRLSAAGPPGTIRATPCFQAPPRSRLPLAPWRPTRPRAMRPRTRIPGRTPRPPVQGRAGRCARWRRSRPPPFSSAFRPACRPCAPPRTARAGGPARPASWPGRTAGPGGPGAAPAPMRGAGQQTPRGPTRPGPDSAPCPAFGGRGPRRPSPCYRPARPSVQPPARRADSWCPGRGRPPAAPRRPRAPVRPTGETDRPCTPAPRRPRRRGRRRRRRGEGWRWRRRRRPAQTRRRRGSCAWPTGRGRSSPCPVQSTFPPRTGPALCRIAARPPGLRGESAPGRPERAAPRAGARSPGPPWPVRATCPPFLRCCPLWIPNQAPFRRSP